jgi:hypothetical protein
VPVKNLLLSSLRAVIKAYPAVIPHLKGKARWVAFGSAQITPVPIPPGYVDFQWSGKTVEFYQSTLERLIRSVYNGDLGGEFLDILANLVQGQLTQAFESVWAEEGEEGALPDYLAEVLENMILSEYDHADGLYRDAVDARVDEMPIDPLIARAALWASRYTDAENEARRLIALNNGEKLEWIEGDTEDKCDTCVALDGIVAYAATWDELGVRPQSPPNDAILCGGWHCDCKLQVTDKRVTRGAREKIQSVISKG